MHVYLVTGVVFTVAMALLISLVLGISVDTLATICKWTFGVLLVLGLFLRARRTKHDEEKQARTAEQVERYRRK